MIDDMLDKYQRALSDYLTTGSEAHLTEAYQLGRKALSSDHGLLEIIDIHNAAMAAIEEKGTIHPAKTQLLSAARFLTECLSPFEMLQQGNKEANAALRRLNDILEESAKRIAHALHDQSAQILGAVYLELSELARDASPAIRERTERIAWLLDMVSVDLRNLSHDLRPPILDQLGLLPALRSLANSVAKRSGIEITVVGMDKERAPPAVETTMYRTVQEALNNVVRHACAQNVHIRLWLHDGQIRCSVTDDGKGFDPNDCTHGLGLIGMRERISALSGTVTIESAPDQGTTIELAIPMKAVS
jgi:signal transduction histidine kinase